MILSVLELRKRIKEAKRFDSAAEAKEFCMQYYFDYVKKLDRRRINKTMAIQSSGRDVIRDKEIVVELTHAMEDFSGVPFDIIVYRGGKMKIPNRPLLSETFLESISWNFAHKRKKNLHKVLVKKGSKIIPLYPINQLSYIGDPEMELIMDTTKLIKHFDFYEY